MADLLADVTPEAEANVKYTLSGNRYYIRFKDPADQILDIQVPVKRAKDDHTKAKLVAALIFQNLQNGTCSTKAEAYALRERLLQQLGVQEAPSRRASRSNAAPSQTAALAKAPSQTVALAERPAEVEPAVEAEPAEEEKKKKEKRKRPQNSARMEGRAATLINSSINGTYQEEGQKMFHGRKYWYMKDASGKNAWIIFYSSPLFQWKICNQLDDKAPVIAFSSQSLDRGHSPPTGPDVQWFVFDGATHTLDTEVKFIIDEPEADANEEEERKRRKKEAKKAAAEQEEKRSELETASLKLTKCQEMLVAAMQLRKEGQLDNAVMLDGRSVLRRNHLNNGIYLARAGKYHGTTCFEKLGGSTKRFLIYSATKLAWKITEKLQDGQSFAYAKVEDRGKTWITDHDPSLVWKVWDGKEAGHNKDPAVTCSKIDMKVLMEQVKEAQSEHQAVLKRQARADSEEGAALSDQRVQAAAKASLASQEPEAVSGAEEAAVEEQVEEAAVKTPPDIGIFISSSDEEAPRGAAKASAKAAAKTPPPASAAKVVTPAAPAKAGVKIRVLSLKKNAGSDPASPKPAVQVPKAKPDSKAVAKMLVHSGMRCRCCFRPVQECENRQG